MRDRENYLNDHLTALGYRETKNEKELAEICVAFGEGWDKGVEWVSYGDGLQTGSIVAQLTDVLKGCVLDRKVKKVITEIVEELSGEMVGD